MNDLVARTLGASGALLALGLAALALAAVPGCDDDDGTSDVCRLEPENCAGGAGGLCDDDHDCNPDLFCCDDNPNCGDGMCTYACENDHDCPADMLCEHEMCFYQCESDEDCAPEMSCEHKHTICEYD